MESLSKVWDIGVQSKTSSVTGRLLALLDGWLCRVMNRDHDYLVS